MSIIRFHESPVSEAKVYECASPAHFLHENKHVLDLSKLSFYYGNPCVSNQITSRDDFFEDIDCTVIQSAGEPTTWAIVSAVISITSAVASLIFKPEIPETVSRRQESKNNSLSDRRNEARPNERVEDIYGQVRSVPSNIMVPYRRYLNNVEYEYGYYCVGRGSYLIEDIKDGDTLGENIKGFSASVYGPGTSPNSGDAPKIKIGEDINQKIINASISKSVNNITLRPPNALETKGLLYRLFDDGTVEARDYPDGFDFTNLLKVGDKVILEDFYHFEYYDDLILGDQHDSFRTKTYTRSSANGTYDVVAVGTLEFKVSIPVDMRSVWDKFGNGYVGPNRSWENIKSYDTEFNRFVGKHSINENLTYPSEYWSELIYSPKTQGVLDGTVGPFRGKKGANHGWCNIACTNGIYKVDSKGNEIYFYADIDIYVYELDDNNNKTGNFKIFTGKLESNENIKSDQAAITIDFNHDYANYEVTGIRTSNTEKSTSTVDDVKWVSLFFASEETKKEFGDVTTIHTLVSATDVSTQGEREINCLATREVRVIQPDYTLSSELYPSRYFGDILANIATDPRFGRRYDEDLNLAVIYEKQREVVSYFGFDEAAYFDFTFDSEDISFEEAANMCCDAAFCKPYRKGRVISVFFEKAQSIGAVFGHRNKVPQSDSFNFSFTDVESKDYDGVVFKWLNPKNNDTQEEIHVPSDRSAQNPKSFEMGGFRDERKATLRAWREYLRTQHQKDTYQTTTTAEARSLVIGQRIEIVNNTISETYDGEIRQQDGLLLRLSQPVDISSGDYEIVINTRGTGTVEAIGITSTSNEYIVKLDRIPSYEIYTGHFEIMSIYSIFKKEDVDKDAYVVQEVNPSDGITVDLKAIQYSDKIYSKDKLYHSGSAFNIGFSEGFS